MRSTTLTLARLPVPRYARESGSVMSEANASMTREASVGIKWGADSTVRRTKGRGRRVTDEDGGREGEQ